MGNCLPKLKKNKVSPEAKLSVKKKKESTISEILSRSSTSISRSNTSCDEIKMIKGMTASEVDNTSVESLVMNKEETVMDELKLKELAPTVQKPVFFQVDFVQGMPHRMPSRLAERMEKKVDTKTLEQLALTEEDECFMNEIMEEIDAKEKLQLLEEQQRVAEHLRNQHLQAIKKKARCMRSRPPTRVGGSGSAEYGARESGGRV